MAEATSVVLVALRLEHHDGSVVVQRVRRPPMWLPASHHRRILWHSAMGVVWRDYDLDASASAECGQFVYREVPPRPFLPS